jgi:Mn2+/Fe2+ NRAMP family transporter
MISSVGSGSVLFTPGVGSRYQYAFLWAALIIIFFMWIMIREVGRYTLVTGKTLLDGYRELPGSRGWAIWLIFVPQVVAAVVTIAGIAALAGSALMIAFPGTQAIYAVGLTLISTVLVVSGQYKGVERASSIMAGILVLAVVVTAIRIFPGFNTLASGLVPSIPQDFDLYFVLPWLGFILAGAAGIMWFSYWVSAREYGGAVEATFQDNNDEHITTIAQLDFLVRQPVDILSVAGIVTVIHTPVIVFLTLYLNKKKLPKALQPGWLATGGMVASGGFFTIFAILYLLNLLGIQLLRSGG